MAETMSPSKQLSRGQAGKFGDMLAAALGKSGFPSAQAQEVLETQGAALIHAFVADIRMRIDLRSKIVWRTVWLPERVESLAKAYGTSGFKINLIDSSYLVNPPRGKVGLVKVGFFKLESWEYKHGFLTRSDLEPCCARRGLTFADPYTLLKVNIADRMLARTHPNRVYWEDQSIEMVASFYRQFRHDEASLGRDMSERESGRGWWYAGVES